MLGAFQKVDTALKYLIGIVHKGTVHDEVRGGVDSFVNHVVNQIVRLAAFSEVDGLNIAEGVFALQIAFHIAGFIAVSHVEDVAIKFRSFFDDGAERKVVGHFARVHVDEI